MSTSNVGPNRAGTLLTRTTTRRLAALAIAAALSLPLAACGSDAADPRAATPSATATAHLDPALRDLLPQEVRDTGRLRVGTDASYAPMSFFGPDGRTIVGMEPDLARAVGTVLGVTLEFRNVDFTAILPDVEAGDLEVGISAMTDTPEREKGVDFVNYFTAGTSIVVQRGNPSGVSDLHDLCGKVVALEKGTTQVDLVKRAQANCSGQPITLATFNTNSDALVQLRTGRAAAVLNDYPPAAYLTSAERTKSNFQLTSTTQYEPGLYGFAVSKQQPAIRDALRGALEQLQRTGVYAAVLQQWQVNGGAISQITVNSGR
jgi:polar amino acid transport system substrate-binding protein